MNTQHGHNYNPRGPRHDEMSALLHKRTSLIKNMEGNPHAWASLRRLEAIEEQIKAADPAYWKKLQEHSKQIGWRGELDVVKFLRKRNWFAKRSFGSWGVDVFAAKGYPNWGQTRSLLIDVKSSNIEYPLFEKVPRDPTTLNESGRTNIPAIRAACLKSQPIRWFWYDGVEIDPTWFD